MSIEKLLKDARDFRLPEGVADARENGRLAFVSKFPLDTLKNLTVDEYVQGTDDNSFSYWLEFKSILFGIGGGNASKFGLYKGKDHKYYRGYGNNKVALSGKPLDTYFSTIITGITSALEFAREDRIDEIKTLDIPIWSMVLQKILSLYYPEKFLLIGSPDVLAECAKDLDVEHIDLSSGNSIQINYECKKKLSSQPELQDWDYVALGSFTWERYLDDSKRDYFILGSKYGESAERDVFPHMFEKSVISIGYASQYDLTSLLNKNHSEITTYLKEKGEEPKSYNALKYFLNLKAGDRIAIKASGSPKGNKGFLSIIGIAEVIEKEDGIYKYEPEGLGHLINVNFTEGPVYKEFSFGGYGRTIHRLSKADHIKSIFKSNYETVSFDELGGIPQDAQVIFAFLKSGLSHREIQKQILGEEAPANGGGFSAMDILHSYDIKGEKKGILNTISLSSALSSSRGKYQEALFLISQHYPSLNTDNHSPKKSIHPLNTILYGPPGTGKTYSTILMAAEIIEGEKITDFTEATRIFNSHLGDRIEFITFHQNYSYEDFIQGLRPDTDNERDLIFEKKDGIFKTISDRALKNISDSERPSNIKKPFEEVFRTLLLPLLEGEVEEIEIQMKRSSYFITEISNKSISFRKSSGMSSHTLSINTLRKMYETNTNLNIQGLSPYYTPLFSRLVDLGKTSGEKSHQTIKKNYVLVIDEINRANISRVFGELITLIEPDKRSHGELPLSSTLPSGDRFVVPSNLYLIGTMNTADKSIALLDIALRRRFDFIAMYPKYENLDKEVYDVDILKAINKNIVKLKGHDFQIGHAYFMGENVELLPRMNSKVIPLLLEYFMNDAAEVKSILTQAGLEVEKDSWPIRILGKLG